MSKSAGSPLSAACMNYARGSNCFVVLRLWLETEAREATAQNANRKAKIWDVKGWKKTRLKPTYWKSSREPRRYHKVRGGKIVA